MSRMFIAALFAVCLTFSNATETWWRTFGEIKPGNFTGGHHEAEEGDPKELKAFLEQTRFDEWVTHEDEFVRISYPKHPLLKLEIRGGNAGIQVEGGVCTTVDNSFQKAYVLQAGSATYGVFLLNPAEWLDDGICLCGPIVHHVYQVEDGCLARFSLLPGGAVKKAQLLGGKLRLMAFEWTHLACPRPIYEEMVERMTLKIRDPLNEAALRQEIKRRYGHIGLSGWIHPGTPLETAEAIMGTKPKIEDDIATWNFDARDHHFALRANLKDGSIVALLDEGPSTVTDKPIEGTLSWADDLLETIENADSKPSEKQLQQLLEAALKASRADDAVERQWDWTWLLHQLVTKHGAQDEAISDTIFRLGLGSANELEILSQLKHPDLSAWVTAQLDKMVAEQPSKAPSNGFSSPVEERAQDASALLDWLIENERTEDATRHLSTLINTDEPTWLRTAIGLASKIPAELAQSVVHKALETAIENQDGELVELTFTAIESTKLTDPEVLIPFVEKIPNGEPDSEWEKAKKQALATLLKAKK